MKEHPNFYENLKEAHIRLRGTVVMYDGLPYYILAITNHKPDGIFRVYLDPINVDPRKSRTMPEGVNNYPPEHSSLGEYLDKWLEDNKGKEDVRLIRKRMDSSYFNKFRPFSLGMCNSGPRVFYLERGPARPSTHQGLTGNMITETAVTLSKGPDLGRGGRAGLYYTQLISTAMHSCIVADHPSAEAVLLNLKDSDVENEAVAFHRHFAFVRGPVSSLFLAYKAQIVGHLPKNNLTEVRLGKHYGHTKEVIAELGLFGDINV